MVLNFCALTHLDILDETWKYQCARSWFGLMRNSSHFWLFGCATMISPIIGQKHAFHLNRYSTDTDIYDLASMRWTSVSSTLGLRPHTSLAFETCRLWIRIRFLPRVAYVEVPSNGNQNNSNILRNFVLTATLCFVRLNGATNESAPRQSTLVHKQKKISL